MKISQRLLGLGFSLFAVIFSSGQLQAQTDEFWSGGAYQPVVGGQLPSFLPGRAWFTTNVAEDGLGYEGSYLTLGMKTHIGQDFLDGRWLFETRGHVSLESGGFFGNVGIERYMTLEAAGADISGGAWFDFDDDQQGDFAHTFTQVGVSGKIKTRRWELLGNGYIPLQTDSYAQGDPTGASVFLGHSIVVQPGLDVALRGFDALLNYRPAALGQVNGSVGFGAYGYSGDYVPDFGGVRLRSSGQFLRGLIVNGELNYDERFDFTGVLQLAIMFGGTARGTEYGYLGRDLEPTIRNDHIVRYQQDLILAIDPDTGLPYNVFHVDNTADPAFADGAFETRYVRLSDAEAASGADDIIFVYEGDGTVRNNDTGIALKDGQLLLGDGVRHLIPLADGTLFELSNDQDGILPRITNRFGGPAVTLASRNTVRGFIMDGSAPGALMAHGIRGNLGVNNFEGVIEDNVIIDPVLSGVSVQTLSGDWRFARNTITGAQTFDGITLLDATDPTSDFEFIENTASGNARDGIHMASYDGARFIFESNVTNGNFRDGVRLQDYTGTRGRWLFDSPIAQNNIGNGIGILNANGNLRVVDADITGNSAAGIRLVDFTNDFGTPDRTFIGTTPLGTSNISGNGAGSGGNISISQNTGSQRVTVTDTVLNGGGTGLFARTRNTGTFLDLTVQDNVSISNNNGDGVRLVATDGSAMQVLVENTGGALPISANGGSGLSFIAGNDAGGATASIFATVRNVSANGSGIFGLFANASDDGQFDILLDNATLNGSGVDAINLNVNTDPVGGGGQPVSRFQGNNLTMNLSGDEAVDITTAADSFFDFALTNSTMNNLVGGAQTGGNGISVTTTGDIGAPIDDNRTRLLVQNNTINGFTFNGINVNASGDSRVLAMIDANTVTNNGPGTDPTALPYFHGVNFTAADESVINLLMTNNQISGNFEQGLNLTTLGGGGGATINSILIGNGFAGNDIGEDTPNPPFTANNSDVTVNNAANGTICLAMSNNFFTLPTILTNAGGAAAFRLELDGATNGPAAIIQVGPVTLGDFSTVCQPNFDAEEAAFEADGFAPW